MKSQRFTTAVCVLTGLCLVWLIAVLFIFGYTPTNDGVGYVELARQCLSEGEPYPTTTIYGQEPFVWNIGIICLTELSLLLSGSLMPLLLLLCVLKAATALFMALTARQLLSERAALAALVLFIVYPNNWGQSTMVSSEIPSTCLSMAAVWVVSRGYGANGANGKYGAYGAYAPYLVAGLLLGLANWFRPTATIFLLSILVFLAFQGRRALWRGGVGVLSGYVLFVAVAGTSCYVRTGHFVYQARSYWFSMVDECYDQAAVAPHWGQPVWPEGTPRYIAPEERRSMDCFDYERLWRQRSLDWLKDHPLKYLSKVPGRLYYMWQSDYDNLPAFLTDKSRPEHNYITLPYRHLSGSLAQLSRAQWLSLLTMVLYAVVLLMAATGAVQMLARRRWPDVLLPLCIVVGGTLLLVVAMHGETRFKDPLMPSLFMLAGVAFSRYEVRGTRCEVRNKTIES